MMLEQRPYPLETHRQSAIAISRFDGEIQVPILDVVYTFLAHLEQWTQMLFKNLFSSIYWREF